MKWRMEAFWLSYSYKSITGPVPQKHPSAIKACISTPCFLVLSQSFWRVGIGVSRNFGERRAPLPRACPQKHSTGLQAPHVLSSYQISSLYSSNRLAAGRGSQKFGQAILYGPPLGTRARLINTLLLHLFYHTKCRYSKSNRLDVIMEIRQKIDPSRHAVQGHSGSLELTRIDRLPTTSYQGPIVTMDLCRSSQALLFTR